MNCQPVGDGQASLAYLSRYVFKVAISEQRILRVDATHVLFHYRKVNSNRVRTMALPILEFMHRFLQHVLPQGLMRSFILCGVCCSLTAGIAEQSGDFSD